MNVLDGRSVCPYESEEWKYVAQVAITCRLSICWIPLAPDARSFHYFIHAACIESVWNGHLYFLSHKIAHSTPIRYTLLFLIGPITNARQVPNETWPNFVSGCIFFERDMSISTVLCKFVIRGAWNECKDYSRHSNRIGIRNFKCAVQPKCVTLYNFERWNRLGKAMRATRNRRMHICSFFFPSFEFRNGM